MLRCLLFSEKKRGLQEEVQVREVLQCLLQCVFAVHAAVSVVLRKKEGVAGRGAGGIAKSSRRPA